MVGLSVVLDSTKLNNKNLIKAQVINKADMIKSSPSSSPSTQPSPQPPHPFSQWKPPSDGQVTAAGGSFLDQCFLCKQKILLGKDIFMYKGDKAFCSEECRWTQIFMDDNFFPLSAAIKQPQPPTSSSSPSPPPPNRNGARNKPNRFTHRV